VWTQDISDDSVHSCVTTTGSRTGGMGSLEVPLKVWLTAVLSVIVLLTAYWYDLSREDDLLVRLELTHESLLHIEDSVSVNPKTKIAIGFGSCVDVIAQTRDVLLDRYSPPKAAKHYEIIETRDELLEVFAYYFQFGAAAEYVFWCHSL
jgi:ADP-dependent glucokinase